MFKLVLVTSCVRTLSFDTFALIGCFKFALL